MLLLMLALLALKVGNSSLILGSLWGEDGNVFLNQALEGGVKAVWSPYNGYLHLFPRLVALLASQFPLAFIPGLFNLGWLLAVGIAVFLICHYGRQHALSNASCLILVGCVLLQPNNGEAFFTLTNAHWFIAIALILFICHPDTTKPGVFTSTALIIAGLTGPFALITLPILVLQTLLHRRMTKAAVVYLIIIGSALIQVYFLVASDRVDSTAPMDPDYRHWLQALWVFFTFGLNSVFGATCALLVWVLFAYALAMQLIRGSHQERVLQVSLLALAAMFYLAGLLTQRHEPQLLSPLGICSRYYLIPYTLLIFSAGLAFRYFATIGVLALVAFALVCIQGAVRVDRGEQQWMAYSRLAEQVSPLYIPIAPSMPAFPGWAAHVQKQLPPLTAVQIPLDQLHVYNAVRLDTPGEMALETGDVEPSIQFSLPQCQDQRYLGVVVHAWREKGGFAQLFWGQQFNFKEQRSVRRFYPTGDVVMHFAFKRRHKDDTLRLDPTENLGKSVIHDVQLVCLGGTTN
ncbi:hypothetical protein [Pseudomonas sp. PDM22]|uniref:hypothetical protein n=1 Tax=Pseudomonas sp. PDM22 TaxID=2769287 RepID=UPI0009DAE82C|nr:hypothetical protein [Pseudomonas sp. PDM22]MBD9515403.1 hypothetical protein [Pseudomonas sp. PDM22]OQR38151.1 hypothetical protein BWR15_01150 [Pseudomonas sp. T]